MQGQDSANAQAKRCLRQAITPCPLLEVVYVFYTFLHQVIKPCTHSAIIRAFANLLAVVYALAFLPNSFLIVP